MSIVQISGGGDSFVCPYNAYMFNRWFIRSCFILPLLLCLGGWVVSMGYLAQIKYSHDGYDYFCGMGEGFVNLGRSKVAITLTDGSITRSEDGWECAFVPTERREVDPHSSILSRSCFGYEHISGRLDSVSYELRVGSVPFWFIFTVFALVLFCAWRKTGKRKTPTGFPMEANIAFAKR